MRPRGRVPVTISIRDLLTLPGGPAILEQWREKNAPPPIYRFDQLLTALEALTGDETPTPAILAQIGAPLYAYVRASSRGTGHCREWLRRMKEETLNRRAPGTDNGAAAGTEDAQQIELVDAPRVPRPRKPITDPAVLEMRNQALARARQARAQKIAEARAGSLPDPELAQS